MRERLKQIMEKLKQKASEVPSRIDDLRKKHFPSEIEIFKEQIAPRVAKIYQALQPKQTPEKQTEITPQSQSEEQQHTVQQNLVNLYQEFEQNKTDKGKKQEFIDQLIIYFLLQKKQEYGEKFNLEKARLQIEAILAMLEGYHLQGETGIGKDTVILPIVAIIEALTSDKGETILSSAKPEKVREFKKTLDKFNQSLPEDLQVEILSAPEEENQSESKKSFPERLKKSMFLEAINEKMPDYSNALKEQLRDYVYLKDAVPLRENSEKTEPNQQTPSQTAPSPSKKPKRVLVRQLDKLIFDFAKNPYEFSRNAPRIFVDEAHIPYDRNTPYVVNYDFEIQPIEQQREAIDNFILGYFINKILSDDDFHHTPSGYKLKDEAGEKIFEAFRNFNPSDKKTKKIINKIITLASRKLNLSDSEKLFFKDYILRFFKNIRKTLFKENDPKEFSNVNILNQIEEISHSLAFARSQKGKNFVVENGQIICRDDYTGEILPLHQFSPTILNAIAVNSDFFYLPNYAKLLNAKTHYQFFIFHLGEKLVFSSGTLLTYDEKGDQIKSPFASFIEDYTSKKIFYFEKEISKKSIPQPYYYEDSSEALKNMLEKANKSSQPLLLVCFSETEADELEKELKKTGKKIGRVSGLSSDEKNSELYTQLADGEIDILISSGSAGEGVDIKKSDGSHPDLHIAIYGLPPSRLKLRQILGRRRAEEKEEESPYFWVLSREHLHQALLSMSEQSLFYEPEKQLKRFEEKLKKYDKNQLPLDTAFKLINEVEKARKYDDEMIVLSEVVQRIIDSYIKNRYKDYLTAENSLPEYLVDDFVSLFFIGMNDQEKANFFQARRQIVSYYIEFLASKKPLAGLAKSPEFNRIVKEIDSPPYNIFRFKILSDLKRIVNFNFFSRALSDNSGVCYKNIDNPQSTPISDVFISNGSFYKKTKTGFIFIREVISGWLYEFRDEKTTYYVKARKNKNSQLEFDFFVKK